jgi:heme/copper-type cytochrome/quinol oxidase subunit 1
LPSLAHRSRVHDVDCWNVGYQCGEHVLGHLDAPLLVAAMAGDAGTTGGTATAVAVRQGHRRIHFCVVVFTGGVIYAFARKQRAMDNLWGEGATTLEWMLSSPPPFHQFNELTRIVETHH